MTWVRQARREGVREKPVPKPHKASTDPQTWWTWVGLQRTPARATPKPGQPLLPAWPEDGQARCRLMAGWGGAPVVVGVRESRTHGKGGQRVLQQGNATSG